MYNKDLAGIADRLGLAMDRGGWSIRSLQRELTKLEVPASSYSSVRAYVNGLTVPRRDWIEAAANVLGVRAEWLRTGSGQITETEETLRERAELEEGKRRLKGLSSQLDGYIDHALGQFVGEEVECPNEVWRCLRGFLLRYFLVYYQEKATTEVLPSERGLPERVIVDEELLKPSLDEIEDFIQEELSPALKAMPLGPGEFAAALLSQLAVLYLRYHRE